LTDLACRPGARDDQPHGDQRGGAGCGFVIDGTKGGASDGTVKFTYTNRTHQVKVSGGNLHVFNVNGCAGLVANGDQSA